VVIRSDQYGLRHDDELTIGLTKFGGAEEEFPVPLRSLQLRCKANSGFNTECNYNSLHG